MDTSFLFSIIVATLAIIPGIWALVNQIRKNENEGVKRLEQVHVIAITANELIGDLTKRVANLSDDANYTRSRIAKLPNTDELWKKMYEKPVIVRCKYCGSANTITNTECVKCGAPQ